MLKNITTFYLLMFVLFCSVLGAAANEDGTPTWMQALPGGGYSFPQDHVVHPEYKTEWWYFTGNLTDESGRQYGYELTFFRQGMLPPMLGNHESAEVPQLGRFVQNDFKFAHFAISDLTNDKFYYAEKINRGAFGEAGFGKAIKSEGTETAANAPRALAWIEQWSLTPQEDGSWKITAQTAGGAPMSINLQVATKKGPVIHGIEGVSQKSAGLGNASHYYSFTRLATTGTLSLGKNDRPRKVTGESWFDHEWASNQLSAEQVGWDWFCCQFDDGCELMLYAMRRNDGSVDEVSSGTWVEADGHSQHLTKQDFQLRSLRTWKSGETGASYPVEWQVKVPSHQLDFRLKARLDSQELALKLISYWEGATSVNGQRAGRPIKGVGYMELTGYAGALKGLQSGKPAAGGALARPIR